MRDVLALMYTTGSFGNFMLNPLIVLLLNQSERMFGNGTIMAVGMDLSSGEFAFVVGFPAKNALSGVVMAVVPGVMGICCRQQQQGRHFDVCFFACFHSLTQEMNPTAHSSLQFAIIDFAFLIFPNSGWKTLRALISLLRFR